jgi:hypothetical protein
MRHLAALLAAFALAVPASAQEAAPMSLEQTMLLRCSVAFALVAGQQQRGDPLAAGYPALAARGKEYFARANARLMDELQLTREQLEARVRGEVAAQQQAAAQASDRKAYVDSLMQPCLVALDASGL